MTERHQRCEWKSCQQRYQFCVQLVDGMRNDSIYVCYEHLTAAELFWRAAADRRGKPTSWVVTTDLFDW